MANLQLYTLAFVTVNGKLLTEHGECSLTRNSNANKVVTVAKGFAGVSPGAPDCEIDVTNAVPAADYEYDAGSAIKQNDVVEMGVLISGKVAVSKGFIMSDSFSHGTGSEAKMSFKFMGQYPERG